ncbi:MAG: hypothetical protein EOM24_04205 [Chloroflexia bacterium]|nr:hypothetical protein [Chloroflexia bacterium]
MKQSCRVVADSKHNRSRLITCELVMWRSMLAEFNTHRRFARNTGSSRAITTTAMIDMAVNDTFVPSQFRASNRGMQGPPVSPETQAKAEALWREAAASAASYTQRLAELGVHKQYANRWLEPAICCCTIATATYEWWCDMIRQRNHEDALPEFDQLAIMLARAIDESKPVELEDGEWHTPLVSLFEQKHGLWASAGRCAGVSYHNQGKYTLSQAEALARRIYAAGHLSPFEHVARAGCVYSPGPFGDGWLTMRHKLQMGVM